MRHYAKVLTPSHQHSMFSATVLMMGAILLSRVIGYLREAYIAYRFGAGPEVDAYVAAFTLPDWLNYIVAGGTASITFVTIFGRYIAEGREEEAQRAFNIVLTLMSIVLLIGIGILEVFTEPIVRVVFPGFSPEQIALCVRLTRILLPAQLFFYVGGVVSAVLLSRRMFLVPALGPLLYNVGIIAGGVFLSRQYGVASLAIGAVAGAIAGPFLANAIGAARTGMGYSPEFDLRNPGFAEWVRLSIPLMLGVSLVTADDWILRYFASAGAGDIARLNYAKRLFAVPLAVLAQAVGQASLPFFARLFGEGKRDDFNRAVNDSVFRVSALGMIGSGWLAAAALPLVDLVYRRGSFTASDTMQTAVFFFWFSLSLLFWAAQSLYSRAFYAAGNTWAPMLAATVVTILSIPIYAALFDARGTVGLAWASNIGIIANTVVIAVLLHQRRLVTFSSFRWLEFAKAALAAFFAGAVAIWMGQLVPSTTDRLAMLLKLIVVTAAWGSVTAIVLALTASELPRLISQRLRRA